MTNILTAVFFFFCFYPILDDKTYFFTYLKSEKKKENLPFTLTRVSYRVITKIIEI